MLPTHFHKSYDLAIKIRMFKTSGFYSNTYLLIYLLTILCRYTKFHIILFSDTDTSRCKTLFRYRYVSLSTDSLNIKKKIQIKKRTKIK